jgi:hypothetical protein
MVQKPWYVKKTVWSILVRQNNRPVGPCVSPSPLPGFVYLLLTGMLDRCWQDSTRSSHPPSCVGRFVLSVVGDHDCMEQEIDPN